MTEERRTAQRVAPKSGDLNVNNIISGEDMGTIANLSETGFMLATSNTIEVDSVFQLVLTYSQDNSIAPVKFGAVCLWNADTSTQHLKWAGFHIIDISDEAQSRLKQIVDDLAAK